MMDTISADGYGLYINDLCNYTTTKATKDDLYQATYDDSGYLTTDPLVAQGFSYLICNDIEDGIVANLDDFNELEMPNDYLWAAEIIDRYYIYAPSIMPFETNFKPHSKEEIEQDIYKALRYLSYEALAEHNVDISKDDFYKKFNDSVDPDSLSTIIDEVHDGTEC